ncbi:hypothetical protein HNY73_020547 [Argiope bruennichi]|uniref:Uncharacterized protein n=2 Tax=Argiope bruennichi TaxID=94029 RepID=A0A8T0E8F7_ARGBR|nr:hypothetical protein HNY73_020547 [Argiope bruennichi]
MGNKNSVSKNFTTQPKPSSPVYCTILYPYQDTKICDYFGNKNICRDSISSASSKFICDVGMKNLISTKDETIRSLADNSSEAVCRKSLIVNQPLNLCTKESEQMDLDPQTFCEFPQLNPCLTDNIGNLASYSPLQSSAKLSFDECCSYERIAKQLIQASSNLQYIEPISVCSSDCDVDCCKPCTCDLGGGKCIPQTCNNFQYIETNSMDSSDNECILPNKEITPNCNLSKFLNNSVLEFKNNSISGDTYETSPLSPLYVVIDDADCDSDDDWNSIKSEVDSVCREFCHNEQY